MFSAIIQRIFQIGITVISTSYKQLTSLFVGINIINHSREHLNMIQQLGWGWLKIVGFDTGVKHRLKYCIIFRCAINVIWMVCIYIIYLGFVVSFVASARQWYLNNPLCKKPYRISRYSWTFAYTPHSFTNFIYQSPHQLHYITPCNYWSNIC